MDLKSGYPFWAISNGLMVKFPSLQGDVRCDVAVVGGGITGALIADELSRHGHEVVVLEKRDIGWGSTAASTALIQYEIDEHMTDLAQRYGEADAALAYGGCVDAVAELDTLCKQLRDVGYRPAKSLYFASVWYHADALRDELKLRVKHGIQVEALERAALKARFGIDSALALLSGDAAYVDPYRLASRLLARFAKGGGQVFDRTTVDDMRVTSRHVELTTDHKLRVTAKYVIFASGYETQRWLRESVCRNRSSYAFVTDPLASEELGWLKDTLVWESKRPYLYVRATSDNRLLVGGEDDAIDIPSKRDLRVDKKAEILRRRSQNLFPHLAIEPVYAWAGTFAETSDGLPFFGHHSQHGRRVMFAMAYGGNGITYSVIGASLLRSQIEKTEHALAHLFSFERLQR